MPQLKNRLLSSYSNLRGWSTFRHLVVFESDDWGAIRTPGREGYQRLLSAGIPVDQSPYDRLDCLESRVDLELLLSLLESHRDSGGRAARFTFNTVMGNPDFEAIQEDGFRHFHHQHFFESYGTYHGEDLEPVWQNAIAEELIRPQFHGREHLNVPLWLNDLRDDRSEARIAFEHRFCGLTTQTSSPRQTNYLAALWAESESQLLAAREAIVEGLALFRETFGYDSTTFVPPNYILPAALQPVLAERGVRLVQGQRGQFVPDPVSGGGHIRRSFTGQRSEHGLLYSVRNVQFEPFEYEGVDWVGAALHQIAQAFRFRTPAIVSTHRVNYVGGMSEAHRDRSLQMLDQLLAAVLARWPDVEFMTSDELLAAMEAS